MVDVAGLEPATPCLQSKGPTLCNLLIFNPDSENQGLSRVQSLCPAVSGGAHLLAGSLQKSLHTIRGYFEKIPGSTWPPMGGARAQLLLAILPWACPALARRQEVRIWGWPHSDYGCLVLTSAAGAGCNWRTIP